MSDFKELLDLKHRIEGLTEKNTDLEIRVATAEKHAQDAQKHAQGATKRAQTRYTEKLHANRRADRLEQDLARERWERNDDQIKSVRLVSSYQNTIKQLREELATVQFAGTDGAQLEAYQNQLAQLEVQHQVSKDENMQLQTKLDHEKTSSADTIQRLNDSIEKLSADLAIEQARNEQAKKEMAPNAQADELETRIKAATKDIERRATEYLARHKLELRKQAQQQFNMILTQKMTEMKREFQQTQHNFAARAEQLKKIHEVEKQKVATLEHQLKHANDQIQWCKQHMQQNNMEQITQTSPGMRVGKHGGIPMTPEQSVAYFADGANKRRRLNSGGAFGITTPDVQRIRTASLLSDGTVTAPTSPASLKRPHNTEAAMPGVQLQGVMMNGIQLQDAFRMQEQDNRGQYRISQSMMSPSGHPNRQGIQQQTGPLMVSQQALLQHLGPNQGARIQGSQRMDYQKMVEQQLAQSSPAQPQAIHQFGGNSTQYMVPRDFQQVPQPVLNPRQAVPQAGANTTLQMNRSNGVHKMQTPPTTNLARLNAQRPATASGALHHPSSQTARNTRLEQKFKASQQKMAKEHGQQIPQLPSIPNLNTPNMQQMPNANAVKDIQEAVTIAQMQPVSHDAGTSHPAMPPPAPIFNSNLRDISALASPSQGSQMSPAQFQSDVDQPQESIENDNVGSDERHEWASAHATEPFDLFDDAQSPVKATGSGGVMMDSFRDDDFFSDDLGILEWPKPRLTNELPSTTANETVHQSFVDPSLLQLNNQLPVDGMAQSQTQQQTESTTTQLPTGGTQPLPSPKPPQLNTTTQQPTQKPKAPASTRSTPAPRAKPTRLTPAPSGPRKITCTNCHRNWWNESCDGEPCTNCAGSTDCVRPRCPTDAAGQTCDKGARCKMVHGSDTQYREQYLVDMKDLPKRRGRKVDARVAPSVAGER